MVKADISLYAPGDLFFGGGNPRSTELRRVHARLREALLIARSTVDSGGDPPAAARDLVVYCRGFCAALGQHNRGEDRSLFPAIEDGSL